MSVVAVGSRRRSCAPARSPPQWAHHFLFACLTKNHNEWRNKKIRRMPPAQSLAVRPRAHGRGAVYLNNERKFHKFCTADKARNAAFNEPRDPPTAQYKPILHAVCGTPFVVRNSNPCTATLWQTIAPNNECNNRSIPRVARFLHFARKNASAKHSHNDAIRCD